MTTMPVGKAKRRQRDWKAERAVARLRKTPLFAALPNQALKSYASLQVMAAEIKTKLAEKGIVDAKGDWSPGLDIYRRYLDSAGQHLRLLLEIAEREGASTPDLDALKRAEKVHEERQ
jgi:hypothetical protein